MNFVQCSYCNKENPAEAIFCMQCGSRLKGHFEKNEKAKAVSKKQLDLKYFYYLIPITIIIGFAVLYLAGVFDSPEVTIKKVQTTENATIQNNVAPVVDLKTAQEIKSLQDFAKAHPDDLTAKLNLGHKYFDTNQFEKAIPTYLEYLNKKPNDTDVLVDLGVCYYNILDYSNAEKYMKKSLELNSNHQIANLNLGIVLSASNRLEEAKEYWQIAYKIDPNSQFGIRAKSFLDNN